MWLCLNRSCDWITELTSTPISLHTISNVILIILKCLSQSPSSKWFVIITSHNCYPHPITSGIQTQDNMTAFVIACVVCRIWGATHLLCSKKRSTGFPSCSNFYFYYWYFAPVSQEVTILFSWTQQCFTWKCFMQYFTFMNKLNSPGLNKNMATVRCTDQWNPSYTSWLPPDSLITYTTLLNLQSAQHVQSNTLTQICIFTASYTASVISSHPHEAKAQGWCNTCSEALNKWLKEHSGY